VHYEDLALCRYHVGPLHADSWQVPLSAIGWLEIGHAYIEGSTPMSLVEKLDVLIDGAGRAFQQYHFRGLHDCTLCEPGDVNARLPRSHINLLIPGKREVFASPASITHYLTMHSYLPPSQFVEAVLGMPTVWIAAIFGSASCSQ
jgi:hypothetical protein